MASGCWPGGGCWARAPRRCSPRAPGIRWPGCWRCPRWRTPACWSGPGGLRAAQERVLRVGRDAADAGVPGAGRGAAGRGRHPGAARGAGPGAGPGPGAGGQDDPPQAGRAGRRGQGRGPGHGAGPPPRRGPAGRAGVPLRRRARPRLLRDPDGAEDPRGAAEVPRPRDDGDLGHRSGGDPVFMVIAEPSDSLAGELRRLLPASARRSWARGGG